MLQNAGFAKETWKVLEAHLQGLDLPIANGTNTETMRNSRADVPRSSRSLFNPCATPTPQCTLVPTFSKMLEKCIIEVAANGDISIELPGTATFEGDLQESVFENTCPYGTLTVTPETSKTVDLHLFLYSNDQRIAQLTYLSETVDGELIEAFYSFSDRDVLNKGTCAWENFDVDMKKGWNTLIIGRFPDGETSGVRTAVPDSSFKWQIP